MSPLKFRNIRFSLLILLLWIFTTVICATSLPYIIGPTVLDTTHSLLLVFNYGFMYLLPTIAVCYILKKWYYLQLITSIAVFTVTIIFLFTDGRLYNLYGFHFNGFVWNLLTTPGGFASLGADQTNYLFIVKYIATYLAGLTICLTVAYYFSQKIISIKQLFQVFLLITLSERIIYGFAYANVYGPILSQTDHMILYQPMKMNSFLSSIGYQVIKADKVVSLDGLSQKNINYPLNTVKTDPINKPYNIIFLVAESMRYQDLLNNRVMPNTIDFAKNHGINFTHHYSGGNGTRQGLFSMFYGLYGSYWDSFLRARKSPLLFDVLNQYKYEYFIYTGARFTYPEFDQTIFGSIPAEKLIETNKGEPWKRDQKNVSLLLKDMETRDRNKPFMGFIFFESTHARYSFPEENPLEKNYLESVDYAGLSREELSPIIEGMKARYINASHYLDTQFDRVYDYLINNDMLENTILIVTGDHGEEFMEKARWGHNSSFVEEQIRVPMIMSFPKHQSTIVTDMTSHMDIATTLLQTLGVSNPTTDYSLGKNLFQKNDENMVIVASWSDLGLITPEGKLVIPFKGTTQHQHLATSKDDTPTDLTQLTQQLSTQIGIVVNNSRKFYNKL